MDNWPSRVKPRFRSQSARRNKRTRGYGSRRLGEDEYGFKDPTPEKDVDPMELETDNLYLIGSNIRFLAKKMNELKGKIVKKRRQERSKNLIECENEYAENYKGLKENAMKLFALLPSEMKDLLSNSEDKKDSREEERRLDRWKMEKLEKDNNKLQKEVDDMRMRLNQEIEAKEDAFKRINDKHSRDEEERRSDKSKMENLVKDNNKLQKEVDDMRMQLKQEKAAKEDAFRSLSERSPNKRRDSNKRSREDEEEMRLNKWKIQKLENDNNKLQREVDDMRMRLNQEVDAKEDAIRRLCELTSSKLRTKDPDVLELSDVNRPTKLAEQISELYDNEWTEAFDEMEKTGRSDEEIVKLLRDSFMDIYKVCKRVNEGYLHRVQKSVDQFDILCSHDLSKDKTNKTDGNVDLPDQFRQQIKDLRKLRTRKNIDKIIEGVLSQDSLEYLQKSPFSGSVTKIYVRKCIHVSWLMCVQDPPLHLSTDTQKKFNLDVFREYTRRGLYVAYVIWPVLYLHLDGPILCKGVAQGTSEKPSGGI